VVPAVRLDGNVKGMDYTGEAEFTDPGVLDTHSARVDWGDGSAEETVAITGNKVKLSHRYAKAGHYKITVKVRDDHADGVATVEVDVPAANGGAAPGNGGAQAPGAGLNDAGTDELDALFGGVYVDGDELAAESSLGYLPLGALALGLAPLMLGGRLDRLAEALACKDRRKEEEELARDLFWSRFGRNQN
jgi:hypothetical protein